ncbi:tyrosine-protein phosphatase [Podospora conica]|nr:tyrosine-protein phosphatase [Schizothecium conicum]
MALDRVNGKEELFVGGIFGLRRARAMKEHKITHILSVVKYSLDEVNAESFRDVEHLSIDVDDVEDEDILVHFPRMVRFIELGLYGPDSPSLQPKPTSKPNPDTDTDAILPADDQPIPPSEYPRFKLTPAVDPPSNHPPGAVFVHCAMGKSRSVTATIAYLLWKHPHRFGRADPTTTPSAAVANALRWIRDTRPLAEPNDGFTRQLEMWWSMGCPATSDDAVAREPAYQRWLYKREVETAANAGCAPDRFRFEDEEAPRTTAADDDGGRELRCKKCRRVLVTQPFMVPHQGRGNPELKDCPHVFIEALSWMRPTLEAGELEGRLVCPNGKCGASVGRYSWQGFKCTCGDWVAPAFSLHRSRVDEVSVPAAANVASRMAALGIRMPPGGAGRQENL